VAKADYYDLLGVSRSASVEDIKVAYRKAALKHHPDRNPGDKSAEEKFKEINEAYEALSSPDKRRAYDQFGHAGAQGGGGPGGGSGFEGGEGFGDVINQAFGDMFGGMFGGGRRRARKGADLQYEHTVTLEEAFSGAQSTLSVGRLAPCSTCHGSGARPGSSVKTCPNCRGAGQVRMSRGIFSIAQTCPRCGGHGQVVENPCPDCRGQGRLRKTENITVRIPPGVEDGTALRVSNAGEAGERGSSPGDLYVVVRVKPHPRFEREDANLITSHKVTVPLAALGGTLEVPTLEKPLRLDIPAGTQSGTLFRVKGAGMPRLRDAGRGDLFVKVDVEIPVKLSKDQRRLFAELAQSLGDNNVSTDDGLLRKVFGK
jgi:molecular chaperone DnaJ